MKKRRVFLIVFLIIVLAAASPYISMKIKAGLNKDILTKLEGEIYYTKRDDEALTLYKSEANLEDEELIYSHKGKGKIDESDHNDNIIDHYYDKETREIEFLAMNDGYFSLYKMEIGEENPELIGRGEDVLKDDISLDKNDYIKTEIGNKSAIEKEGSIYIVENGEERLVKKFYGMYDFKFTGYSPIGFSPDGKYLIYNSMEHLTSVGVIIDGMIGGFGGNKYIMDLETGKSARYVNAYNIQWVMDDIEV